MKSLFIIFLATVITFSTSQFSNEIIVKGIVLNASKEALIGANIVEVGTQNGTVADIDGKFELKLKNENNQIVVNYLGYADYKFKYEKGKDYYEVILIENSTLEEVVITGLGVKMETKCMGYASANMGKKRKDKSNPQSNNSIIVSAFSKPIAVDDSKDLESSGENYSNFADNKFISTKIENTTTMSIDVDRASYANIRRFINYDQLPPADAVRTEEMINYFDYSWPAPKTSDSQPFNFYQTYSDCPWNKENKILTIALKGKELDKQNIKPSNLVFLIDVSGSMDEQNKLPLLKESFKLLVQQLSEKDKVSIVVYAGAAGTILEGIPGSKKPTIIEALDNLQAGGSTAGAQGIIQAYNLARKHFIQDGNNRVILATDGDFNVGINSEEGLIKLIEKERLSQVYLSVLGFGMGNYQDAKMQQLADKGNGNHFYIDNIQEANKSLIKEFGGSLFTIAKDVKIQLEFNKDQVASYRAIGYENRQLANEDFDDDSKDAGEMGAGHIVTVMYEIVPSQSSTSDNIATIKYRYKPMNSGNSIKQELPIHNTPVLYENANQNVKWALAVAEFGLLLRNSPYKGDADYDKLVKKIEKISVKDEYRNECIELIKKASLLSQKPLAKATK